MTKEWKDGIRSAALSVGSAILLLVITAVVKGEELKGLSKAAVLLHLLKAGVPLWLFLIVLVVAILGAVRWYKSRHKPLVHVEWKEDVCLWTVAQNGSERWMQIMLYGFFNNSDPEIALIITSVYLEGTKSAMSLYETIELPPQHVCDESVSTMVKPVLLEEGKTFRGNVILVDQFKRKHKSYIELKGHKPQVQAKPDAAKSAT
jgi:hypothetical protein